MHLANPVCAASLLASCVRAMRSRRHGTSTSIAAVHEVPMQLACTCGVKRCQHQPELGAGAQYGEHVTRLQQQDRCPAMHACRLRPKLCWPQAMTQLQQPLQCIMDEARSVLTAAVSGQAGYIWSVLVNQPGPQSVHVRQSMSTLCTYAQIMCWCVCPAGVADADEPHAESHTTRTLDCTTDAAPAVAPSSCNCCNSTSVSKSSKPYHAANSLGITRRRPQQQSGSCSQQPVLHAHVRSTACLATSPAKASCPSNPARLSPVRVAVALVASVRSAWYLSHYRVKWHASCAQTSICGIRVRGCVVFPLESVQARSQLCTNHTHNHTCCLSYRSK